MLVPLLVPTAMVGSSTTGGNDDGETFTYSYK